MRAINDQGLCASGRGVGCSGEKKSRKDGEENHRNDSRDY